MYNIDKDLAEHLIGTPPGTRNSAVHWFQKQVARQSLKLRRDFPSLDEWQEFKHTTRSSLLKTIGLPQFPLLKNSPVRARIRLGDDVLLERTDVYVDDDYYIPAFVFSPLSSGNDSLPALIWSPGYPQNKWQKSYQLFAQRMASQGFVVLIPDHAPFGETAPQDQTVLSRITVVNSAGMLLGISQLALRAAENIRCKEYLQSRPDVDSKNIALAGLCQGGMDAFLAGAIDEDFCAVAPFCAASTFSAHMTEMSSYRVNAETSPFPFGILQVCDTEHLHAFIAPRPLLVRANLPDDWWPVSGYDDIESFTRKIYQLYGAEDNVDFRAEINEHDLTGPFAEALESFLLKFLKSDSLSRPDL